MGRSVISSLSSVSTVFYRNSKPGRARTDAPGLLQHMIIDGMWGVSTLGENFRKVWGEDFSPRRVNGAQQIEGYDFTDVPLSANHLAEIILS